MNDTNTGGPAFPSAFTGQDEGMSLRDYFAAKAMQGLISADQMTPHDYVANDAYGYADAMLKARQAC
jgi:hypothetical protein